MQLAAPAAYSSLTHNSHHRSSTAKPGLGDGATKELRKLSVERAELESTKAGRKVYVKKAGLFFLSSKEEALDLNAQRRAAAEQDVGTSDALRGA